MNGKVYKKRSGTSGIQGQLYETKLMSLILFRALHDHNIEDIKLATNLEGAGAFDDISFRIKIKSFDKPFDVYIQAKHKENDNKVLTLNSKSDLIKYFESYLTIIKDNPFGGKSEDTECVFVMYTPAKGDPGNVTCEGRVADIMNELIGTGDQCSQLSLTDEDTDVLCEIIMKQDVSTLAENMAKVISDGILTEMELYTNDRLLRYHVLLAHNVFDISEIKPEGHRVAGFKQNIKANSSTERAFLSLFMNVLCSQFFRRRKIETKEKDSLLSKLLNEPFDITVLSDLLECVLTFTNNKLEFVSKAKEDLKQQLSNVIVSKTTADEAAQLATKKYLLSKTFKVPAAFGNEDLTIKGDTDKKIDKRLSRLTNVFADLIDKSTNNVVTIDATVEDGFLKLNGGIASAVGNILVYDDISKLLKFTNDYKSLSNLAQRFYTMLVNKIERLHEYRFDVKDKKLPKLSFERNEYDEHSVRNFYSKLLFFTNQADHSGVEDILKEEIEEHSSDDINNLRADVIFLQYHDDIQKLWMKAKEGSFLTKTSKLYENAVNNAMSESLIGVFNIMHKIKSNDYTFNENAIESMELRGPIIGSVIVSESSVLTVAKVQQYVGKKDRIFLDLEYIFKLPSKDQKSLCKELTNTIKEKISIIVATNIKKSSKTLKDVAKAVAGKQVVIITNEVSVDIVTEHFSDVNNLIHDETCNLTDISVDSQKEILETSKLLFQGQELTFSTIVDEESVKFVELHILNKFINNETVVVGKLLTNPFYEKVKQFYIQRRVSRIKKHEQDNFDNIKDKVLESLYDLKDYIVLITAVPGMGKSTLLTHLSLQTKELDPKVWIIRINLLEHSRQLSDWQKVKTEIDILESLRFMCRVALSEERSNIAKENDVIIELEDTDSTVSLIKCSGDAATEFELKMFLHFYNKGKVIFVFDGFDEIFPHYASVALSLLNTVRNYPRKHKIWITSRSFNQIKSILEQKFGASYGIEHFTRMEQDTYLYTFWNTKLKVRSLNNEQLQNIQDFIHFIAKYLPNEHEYCVHQRIQHTPYFKVYLNFVDYLQKEAIISHILFSYDNYNSYMTGFDKLNSKITNFMLDFIAPPLHLYLLADFFQNKIKDTETKDHKWDIDNTGYIFYEYYLETKLKNIRFEEKNQINLYNPDNQMVYEKERADCIDKHKKLGAYAIFYPYVENIFVETVLTEIKDTIAELRDGREKTGVIRTVADNIPLFIHMSFAEYFACEYICDELKKDNTEEKQKALWDFILNKMFFECDMNIFNTFDTKVKMDKKLSEIVEKNKNIIFDLLSGHVNKGGVFRWSDYEKVDMEERGVEYKSDRTIAILSLYNTEWYRSHAHEPIDFSQLFNFFYCTLSKSNDGVPLNFVVA